MTRTVTTSTLPKVGDTIALTDIDGVERQFRLYGYCNKEHFTGSRDERGFYIGNPAGSTAGNIWFKRNADYTTYVLPSFTDAEKLAEIRHVLEVYDPEHVLSSDIWEVLNS